ncbi:signal recognition particle subunit FFH/SRP54 (srp54) [Natranaerovirga hydrolytica]|uniref:Signal recognition particle protein n=1 Tax=Natranaerovirga hydrolytica TaxID=680378 RepID=A0A4R1MYE0_9FIRM|nr:signal recognition particle protein [Natranaerovirga hydrolytica]TCK98308.1 signal recognition particle subunit FFH/SRP54 (srp54) [Natranaerovirga hydrolytica]
MAFESLSDKLQNIFSGLKKKGKLSEKDVKTALREVKLALLEADVNFKVVKTFIKNVQERATGHEVLESLTPGQQVIKIVNEELVKLMGDSNNELTYNKEGITVVMMVGLQGAGKTTTSAKISGLIKKKGKKPLLVACDIYRPAAIKQLQIVGEQIDVPVFTMGDNHKPVNIAKAGLEYATKNGNDVVIIDTAGRLHIDETMMDELVEIKDSLNPQETLLVVDAMTGQDAVTVAETFNNQIGVDGVILTKLDGDTRGGAAISVRFVTDKPIKFVGMGEKLTDLEPFHPDRMASRILGMGDVLTLIEKAQDSIDEKQALEMEKKLRNAEFTFDDFLEQMQQVKKMGNINQLMDMIPGMGQQLKNVDIDENEIYKVEAIILSMTKEERANPALLNTSRKKRIALGSGRPLQDVNKLVKQYEQSKKMMKQFSGMMKGKGKKGMFKFPFI